MSPPCIVRCIDYNKFACPQFTNFHMMDEQDPYVYTEDDCQNFFAAQSRSLKSPESKRQPAVLLKCRIGSGGNLILEGGTKIYDKPRRKTAKYEPRGDIRDDVPEDVMNAPGGGTSENNTTKVPVVSKAPSRVKVEAAPAAAPPVQRATSVVHAGPPMRVKVKIEPEGAEPPGGRISRGRVSVNGGTKRRSVHGGSKRSSVHGGSKRSSVHGGSKRNSMSHKNPKQRPKKATSFKTERGAKRPRKSNSPDANHRPTKQLRIMCPEVKHEPDRVKMKPFSDTPSKAGMSEMTKMIVSSALADLLKGDSCPIADLVLEKPLSKGADDSLIKDEKCRTNKKSKKRSRSKKRTKTKNNRRSKKKLKNKRTKPVVSKYSRRKTYSRKDKKSTNNRRTKTKRKVWGRGFKTPKAPSRPKPKAKSHRRRKGGVSQPSSSRGARKRDTNRSRNSRKKYSAPPPKTKARKNTKKKKVDAYAEKMKRIRERKSALDKEKRSRHRAKSEKREGRVPVWKRGSSKRRWRNPKSQSPNRELKRRGLAKGESKPFK